MREPWLTDAGLPRVAVVADALALARRGMVATLEAFSIEVRAETHSARDLLALAAHERADLVLVGALVDSDPADTVLRCKQLEPGPLVIALLAPQDQAHVAAVVAAGADGVFSRGVTSDELADGVAHVVKGERTIGASLNAALRGAVQAASGTRSGRLDADGLSAREREMLTFLAEGRSNREIAAALSLSLATVKSHLVRLYAKLGVSTRGDALAAAVTRGILL